MLSYDQPKFDNNVAYNFLHISSITFHTFSMIDSWSSDNIMSNLFGLKGDVIILLGLSIKLQYRLYSL